MSRAGLITAAELRARLIKLGMSPPEFAGEAGLTLRHLRRVLAGEYPVTEQLTAVLTKLEEQADLELAAIKDSQEPTLVIPHVTAKRGTWAHMIAARALAEGSVLRVEYEKPADQK